MLKATGDAAILETCLSLDYLVNSFCTGTLLWAERIKMARLLKYFLHIMKAWEFLMLYYTIEHFRPKHRCKFFL